MNNELIKSWWNGVQVRVGGGVGELRERLGVLRFGSGVLRKIALKTLPMLLICFIHIAVNIQMTSPHWPAGQFAMFWDKISLKSAEEWCDITQHFSPHFCLGSDWAALDYQVVVISFNSLGPSDALGHHGTLSTLSQVTACCLFEAKLSSDWRTSADVLSVASWWKTCNPDSSVFIQESAFGNLFAKWWPFCSGLTVLTKTFSRKVH